MEIISITPSGSLFWRHSKIANPIFLGSISSLSGFALVKPEILAKDPFLDFVEDLCSLFDIFFLPIFVASQQQNHI